MVTVKNMVIVWGNDNFNTLGILRQLDQAEINLFFLINGGTGIAAKSCHCRNYTTTINVEDGFAYLMSNYKDETIKPILIATGDEIISCIDSHRFELIPFYILPGTKEQGLTSKYIDKNNLIILAKEIGILCPKSYKVQWDTPIDNIEFPCIIKPSHEKHGYYNEFKYRVCKDKAALRRILRLVRHDSEFNVQSYIAKENDVLIYGARLMDGQTILAGAMLRDRWDDCGSASHGVMTSEIPKCIDKSLIISFLERIDYYGLFSFEYAMLDNAAYFFEVNLRNDGTSHYFFQSGANIPLAYVYSCAGLDYSNINTSIIKDKYFIDEVFDIENVIHRRITYKQWKKDRKEASVFKYYDINDQEPWKAVQKHSLKTMMRDMIVKRFRPYIVFFVSKIGLRKK